MFELFVQQRPRHIAIAAEFDLSPMQAFALRLLEPGTPLPMSDLAEALHCDASNVTGIVDRLEDRGLIARRAADHDRRVKMLVVTESGAALRERLLARISEPPLPIAALSAADQRALRDILRRALG
jgi:DNA-binding MarR family transcriptional regulator